MKEYKRCLDAVKHYLNDKTFKLNAEKLDEIISDQLEKPINEMDINLIDLCLNALVAYRKYITEQNDS